MHSFKSEKSFASDWLDKRADGKIDLTTKPIRSHTIISYPFSAKGPARLLILDLEQASKPLHFWNKAWQLLLVNLCLIVTQNASDTRAIQNAERSSGPHQTHLFTVIIDSILTLARLHAPSIVMPLSFNSCFTPSIHATVPDSVFGPHFSHYHLFHQSPFNHSSNKFKPSKNSHTSILANTHYHSRSLIPDPIPHCCSPSF